MNGEPIRTIEVGDSVARVYGEQLTRYEDSEGEVIAQIPFAVDERLAGLALVAYQCGHDKGFSQGKRQGRKEVIEFVHEILGVDKLIDRVGTIAEAHA